MPYSLDLEKRLDQIIPQFGTFIKRKMFGGVGYLLNGNMAFGIHKNSLLVRTDPNLETELLKRDGVSLFDMTGRPMKGWLLISPEDLKTDAQLLVWLNLALNHATTLPKK